MSRRAAHARDPSGGGLGVRLRRRFRGRLWRRSPGGGWAVVGVGVGRSVGLGVGLGVACVVSDGSRRSGARGSRRPPSRGRLGSRARRLDERQRRTLRRRRGGCALRTRDGQERPGRPGPTDARGDADRDEGQGRQHHERSTRIAKESAPRGVAVGAAVVAGSSRAGRWRTLSRRIGGDPGPAIASAPRDGFFVPIGSGCTGRPDPIRHLVGCERDGRRDLLRRRVGGSPAQASDDMHCRSTGR